MTEEQRKKKNQKDRERRARQKAERLAMQAPAEDLAEMFAKQFAAAPVPEEQVPEVELSQFEYYRQRMAREAAK